ncbi:hypothetical protein FNV43_RR07314 [Rhamnella rubrinervis]|uniref:Thaumatin-like protein n=1 Tax=Rhamnella rubrinervis TaxID=2594499 RepID=A0A8K0MM30_9ROSA|nr:hypothetical protein FNV43_RR07314 [Rhamnella rubrinervis]
MEVDKTPYRLVVAVAKLRTISVEKDQRSLEALDDRDPIWGYCGIELYPNEQADEDVRPLGGGLWRRVKRCRASYHRCPSTSPLVEERFKRKEGLLPINMDSVCKVRHPKQLSLHCLGSVPGGGRKLNRGETWTLNVNQAPNRHAYGLEPSATSTGRVVANARPVTVEVFWNARPLDNHPTRSLNMRLTSSARRTSSTSLVDGFNVPMEFSPTSNGFSRGIKCTADINGQCPNQLKAPGGCHNPCTVFKTDEYCCNSGKCGPTNLSRFFKDRCRDAYSYPKDDPTSTFTCPEGTNYRVIFCP